MKKTSVDFTYCIIQEGSRRNELIIGSQIRKEKAEDSDRHFVHKTSGMLNEQLKSYAVVGITGELRAEINSKELINVGHNNSSLSLKTTSVVKSEMGTKLHRLVPICVLHKVEIITKGFFYPKTYIQRS